MAMYLGGQAVKILAPSINLFDKSLIQDHATDFSNCSWTLSADKNTITAKGDTSTYIDEFISSKGWVGCGARTAYYDSKGIKLNKGDVVTVSADITLIKQGDKSAAVRCYLGCKHPINTQITPINQQGISETPQRLTWKIEAIYDAVDYYPIFAINSNEVKIENISVNKVKDYWRIRSGVNMGRNPKNLIPLPYAENNKTESGITWTVNDDGTVTANGTATATSAFLLSANVNFLKPNTQYVYSAIPKGVNGEPFNYYAYIQANKNGAWYKEYGETGNGTVFTAENGCEFFINLWIRAGTVVNNVTFKPMLNEGTEAERYFYYD